MFKISKKIEYALFIFQALKQPGVGGLITAKQISQSFALPYQITTKILQRLVKGGLLKSVQGVNGGYSLNCQLDQINLKTLQEVIDGKKSSIIRCLSASGRSCELISHCQMQAPLTRLNQRVNDFLEQASLLEIVG